jgi:tetratricopeptide (TPR) repeat protein
VEAYSAAPDPRAAFKRLATSMLGEKFRPALAQLVALEIQRFPDDPWVYYYSGRMHQAAGEYDAADAAYAQALPLANAHDQLMMRSSRVYARFLAGKGLSAYHEIAPPDKVFTQLAQLYSNGKQGDNLAKLVAARRADAPDDSSLPLWDADAKFLAGDYAAAVDLLTANRLTIEADKFNGYRWSDLYIRCQVRLKNFEMARAEANRSTGTDKNWWRIAIVECAAGNVPEGTKALDALLKDDEDYDLADFYADPDIGPALSTPAFADWREKHPNPATQPTSRPAVDLD